MGREFARWLGEAMKQRGVKQRDIERRTNGRLKQSSVSLLLKGNTEPKRQTVLILAEALEVDPWQAMAAAGLIPEGMDAEAIDIAVRYGKLTGKERAIVRAVLGQIEANRGEEEEG